MSDYLPERVVTEILCKLPIKSILQCTSVCKSWYFLIRSPAFISTHLTKTNNNSNSNNNKKQLLLLLLQSPKNGEERYTLHLDDDQFNDYLHLHLPPTTCDPISCLNEVIGSCNGVLFVVHRIRSGIDSCYFWNPLTRKSVFLPQLEPYSFKDCYTLDYFGFGFDSEYNDYKVLRIARSCSGTSWKQINVEYEVYSLNAGTWKNVTSIAPNHEIDPGSSRFAFVNGSVHFLGFQRIKNVSYEEEGCYSVLAFDVGQEVFQEMMLPKPLVAVPVTTTRLSVWAYKESSIAIVEARDSVVGRIPFCVWFMKEYGAEDSWTKLLVFKEYLPTRRISGLVTFRKNGELLLKTSVQTSEEDFAGGLLSYDPESQQFRIVRFWWEEFMKFVFSYVESLVLLNFDESALKLSTTKLFANASPLDLGEDVQTSGAGLIVETNAEFSVSDDDHSTDRQTKTSPALPSDAVASKSGSSLALSDGEELTKLVSQLSAFEQVLNIDPSLPDIPGGSASFHHDERDATEVAQTFPTALSVLERGPTILSSPAIVCDLRKYLEFLTTHSLNAGMQVGQSSALDNILKDLDHIVADVSVQYQIAEETEETRASLENFKAAFSLEFGMLKAEMKKEASLARKIVQLEAKLKALKADHTRAQVKIKDLAKSSSTIKDVVAKKQSRVQSLLHSEAQANTRFRQIEEMFALAVLLMKASPL